MQWRIIDEGTQRTFALVFDSGDEILEGLKRFAHDTGASADQFTGLGALSDVVLGYFDWRKKDYRRIAIGEQVEVVSLVGNFGSARTGRPSSIRISSSPSRTVPRVAATFCTRMSARLWKWSSPNRRRISAAGTIPKAGSP